MVSVVKKLFLFLTLFGICTSFLGCELGGSTPAAGGVDTIYAMTVIHPEGWSPMIDSSEGLSSTARVSGGEGEPATIVLNRDVQRSSSVWPYADMLGAMDGSGRLLNLDSIEITYRINSISPEADGVSFAITSGYNTSIEEAGWARFHVVMTGGNDAGVTTGVEITETYYTHDFFISFGGGGVVAMPEDTRLDHPDYGIPFLERANSLTFSIESEEYSIAQSLNLTISDIKLYGASGLKGDMNIFD